MSLNLAQNASVKVAEARVRSLWISGPKQAAGRWGAPGSVAAGKAAHETPVLVGNGVLTVTDDTLSRRKRFRRMKYGLFVHYVWDGGGAGVDFDQARLHLR